MEIPLTILTANYRTSQGNELTLFRPCVSADFRDQAGRVWNLPCIIDTAAPLSVVPFRLWHQRNLAWSSISIILMRLGRSSALLWRGVPCELGFTEIDLAGTRSLTAKFVIQPSPPTEVILGLNFLVDNDIELVIRSEGGRLSGHLLVS